MVSGNSFKTITNALEQNLKPSTDTDACKPQPVHRLDYPTTGVLLVGKTNSSIRQLNKLFEDKIIQKQYYAVTIGKMGSEGQIATPIDDKAALTEYKVYETLVSERFDFLNLVQLNPKTGRRHQLRKHLSSIGHPILGDRDYSPEALLLKGKGLYLHAYRLEFVHPYTQKNMIFTAEFPKKFQQLFKRLA